MSKCQAFLRIILKCMYFEEYDQPKRSILKIQALVSWITQTIRQVYTIVPIINFKLVFIAS